MYFAFRWKHQDGSLIGFGPEGWCSDDPAKNEWLKSQSESSRGWPIIPSRLRIWLQQQCELLEFSGIVPE